jgi:Uma2 family endonuclease
MCITSFLAMPAEHVYVPIMPPLMTAEDLLKPGVPERADLVRGVLVVHEPPGFRHGEITVLLTIALGTYIDTHHLGRVVAGDAGFKLQSDPDTVRGADIAFVSWERLPQRSPIGFPPLGPDLVVEVLSPGDRPGETLAKIGDWLSAGTRLVWVVDPERRLARIFRHDGSESILGADDSLDGEDVLPGFRLRLATVLPTHENS